MTFQMNTAQTEVFLLRRRANDQTSQILKWNEELKGRAFIKTHFWRLLGKDGWTDELSAHPPLPQTGHRTWRGGEGLFLRDASLPWSHFDSVEGTVPKGDKEQPCQLGGKNSNPDQKGKPQQPRIRIPTMSTFVFFFFKKMVALLRRPSSQLVAIETAVFFFFFTLREQMSHQILSEKAKNTLKNWQGHEEMQWITANRCGVPWITRCTAASKPFPC